MAKMCHKIRISMLWQNANVGVQYLIVQKVKNWVVCFWVHPVYTFKKLLLYIIKGTSPIRGNYKLTQNPITV